MKVAYINYCYNIEKMIECNNKLRDLNRKKGIIKLHMKKYMKQNNLTKEQVTANPSLVPPAVIRKGAFKKEELNLRLVELAL